MPTLDEILKIARPMAWEAADILRSHYRGKVENLGVEYKTDDDPVTIADIAVSNHIINTLQTQLGDRDFGYICEETYNGQSAPQEYVWIIDPLDGTRDFIDKTDEYAIHIALVRQHRPILAVVAVPEAEKLYYATLNGGAYVESRHGETKKLQVSSNTAINDLTVLASRSHRSKPLDHILQNLPCQNPKNVGSIGCKIATIVEQDADVYISLSGKSAPKDWDIAAPELILTEAGGKYTRFDGSALIYNTDDVNQWGGLIASNGQYHQQLGQKAETLLQQWQQQNPN